MAVKKLYKKETFKCKDDWLKARGLGGSSASAILDKNPYMSKLELYKAIVMPSSVPKVKENESMYYGTQCEPLMRKLFKLDFAKKYKVHTPRNFEMYRRVDKPYITATVDGLLREISTKRLGIWECKTHDIRNKADESKWDGQIPENYYCQVLHYFVGINDAEFAILEAKLNFFDYFDPEGKKLKRTEIRYYFFERSELQNDINFLEKKETEFWENNITKKVMPIMTIKF